MRGLTGFLLIGLLLLTSSESVFARSRDRFQGWVRVSSGRELWVDWIKAEPGQKTIVPLNGLTYSTTYWDRFTDAVVPSGIGVFRYDPAAMGKTLLRDAPVTEQIPYQDQVRDLHDLLRAVGLHEKVNLVGLSYGGGLGTAYAAEYPDTIEKLILMAPYTAPLAEQDRMIKHLIQMTRLTQPFNPASNDALYDFFLRQIIYATYPAAEPAVLENPYKLEATFRLVQGIRKWTTDQVVDKLPAGKVHLMIAGRDQYIQRSVLEHFWHTLQGAKGSVMVVENTEHKIPEAAPAFAAAWVREVVNGNPLIRDGRPFVGDPSTGTVTYKGGKLQISAKMPKRTPTHEIQHLDLMREEASLEVLNGIIQRTAIRSCLHIHGVVQ